MITFISCCLVVLATLLGLSVAVFLVEIVAAVSLPQRSRLLPAREDSTVRVAVLVPAHNESINLLPTITDIKAQLRAGDRLLVVADNCSDDTAAVAAAAAEVVIRNDTLQKGKGFALDFGLRHLAMEPPDVVIFVDADCRVTDGAIDRLAAACQITHRPVQALNLMIAPHQCPINFKVAEFAWRVKNWVRPLGLKALGLPCQLMGTGMACPWDLIRSVDVASSSISEDLKLGFDLALSGNPPLFCAFSGVTSEFPLTVQGARSQRQRWEQGHIRAIVTMVPRLIFFALKRADWNLMAMALDAAVPPLSLLVTLLTMISIVAGLLTGIGGSWVPMSVSLVSLFALLGGVFVCWLKYGRDLLQLGSILLMFRYVLGKLPLYGIIFFRNWKSEWIRTDRRKL